MRLDPPTFLPEDHLFWRSVNAPKFRDSEYELTTADPAGSVFGEYHREMHAAPHPSRKPGVQAARASLPHGAGRTPSDRPNGQGWVTVGMMLIVLALVGYYGWVAP